MANKGNSMRVIYLGRSLNSKDLDGGGRNSSLDLLRIISMIMIIFLHINSHGKLMKYWSISSINGILLRFLHICCIAAVNAYVLISGYFLIYQKVNVIRLLKIIVETLVWSWLVGVVFILNGKRFTNDSYLKLFFPISYEGYWFVSAYIGLSILSPFINKLLEKLKKRQHFLFVIVLLCMHSIFRDIFILSDPFGVSKGYSLVWFVTLYVVAAYMRKYVELDSIKHPFVICIGAWVLMFVLWGCIEFLSERFGFIEKSSLSSYWARYNSGLNACSSIFLFISFAKMKINSTNAVKIIGAIAPLTFGVYLIHDNIAMRDFLWMEIFNVGTFENNAMLIPKALLVAIIIFISCTVMDFIRKTIFDSCVYKRKYFSVFMNRVDRLLHKFMERIPN